MIRKNRFELISLAIRFEDLSREGQRVRLKEENYHQLINYYDEQCQSELALKVIEHAFSFHPYTADFLLRQAELLIDLNLEEQAMRSLDRAAVLDPDSLRIGLLRAEVYSRLDLFDDAIACLEELKSTHRPEEKSDIYYYEAKVYERRGRAYVDQSFKSLQNAILFNENNHAAFQSLFQFQYLSKWSECFDLFKRKTDENPYHALSWYALGEIYAGEFMRKDAIECFENAYLSDATLLMAYLRAAEEWQWIGNHREALKCYADVSDQVRDNASVMGHIGRCHLELGEFGVALNILRHTARLERKLGEENGDTPWLLGRCFMGTNRTKTAVGYFQEAIQLQDDNELYRVDLARAYADLKKYKNACRQYDAAVTIAPEDNNIWYEFILFQQRIDRLEDALETLEMGNLNVGNPEFQYIEALVWYREGQTDRALQLLADALDEDYECHDLLKTWGADMLEDTRVRALIAALKPFG